MNTTLDPARFETDFIKEHPYDLPDRRLEAFVKSF